MRGPERRDRQDAPQRKATLGWLRLAVPIESVLGALALWLVIAGVADARPGLAAVGAVMVVLAFVGAGLVARICVGAERRSLRR